ncbi:hypothetical protein AAG906_022335 [Vitis piasezkii]
MRQMRISDGAISWDDFDGIERYTGIGCPKIHLRLYNSVMRAHGLDEAQLIMFFPMSLSEALYGIEEGIARELEASYLIPSAPSPTDYYSSCTEADTTIFPASATTPRRYPSHRFLEDDNIHMLSWDDGFPESIVLDDGYEVDAVGSQTSTPFSLISDWDSTIHTLYILRWLFSHKVPSVYWTMAHLERRPLATAIALGYAPSTLVLRIPTFFNLLLGRSWIHIVGAILSPLHQKVKFIHDKDFVAMSFDQHSNTVVLDMMRGMFFLLATVDHDIPFGLGFVPTKERVRARLTCTPFDYPVRPYEMSLVDYFIRESEVHPHIGNFGTMTNIDGVDEL